MTTKNIILILLAVVIVGLGAYLFIRNSSDNLDDNVMPQDQDESVGINRQKINEPETGPTIKETPVTEQNKEESILGKSVEGRDIVAYHYGGGDTEILFVGGIHGGYSWNTALVAYETMDYLKANPDIVPGNVRATVIPALNPDGLFKVVGIEGRFTAASVSPSQAVQTSGRFNANGVDINRNFDCDWQSAGIWQNTTVDGGSEVFSEPESAAVKNYIETQKPEAVVVWYSAAGGVFASNCHEGILPETGTITNIYAQASGYPAYEEFDFYKLTGDMTNWLAKKKIPAISILLSTHEDVEWDKNLAGIKALLLHYAK